MAGKILIAVIAVVAGIIAGGVLNIALILASWKIYPTPEGVNLMDPANAEAFETYVRSLPTPAFLLVLLAHAGGALVGGFVAALIAGRWHYGFGAIIGVFFLMGGISNLLSIPAPLWFSIADLISYIPCGLLGAYLAPRHRASVVAIGVLVLALVPSASSTLYAQPVSSKTDPPPSQEVEEMVVSAFAASYDGWSVDEVLLQDDLRQSFLDACLKRTTGNKNLSEQQLEQDQWCRALLHARKQGGRLPSATRRADRLPAEQKELLEASAEIAGRRLWDERGAHIDSIVVDHLARERFNELCGQLQPDAPADVMRRLALNLRKARKLEPELLARVTEWQRDIVDYPIEELQANLNQLPRRPGIYVFRDLTGYLYIGQAQDLRVRLAKHIKESDCKALGHYLQQVSETSPVVVELHVFQPGSPAEQLAVRRAYESELIRTRKPRYNTAP